MPTYLLRQISLSRGITSFGQQEGRTRLVYQESAFQCVVMTTAAAGDL